MPEDRRRDRATPVTPGLPQPNQFDDFRHHVELRRECQRLHAEGERLFARGDFDSARELFARGVELMEICQLLEERWKPRPIGSVEKT